MEFFDKKINELNSFTHDYKAIFETPSAIFVVDVSSKEIAQLSRQCLPTDTRTIISAVLLDSTGKQEPLAALDDSVSCSPLAAKEAFEAAGKAVIYER